MIMTTYNLRQRGVEVAQFDARSIMRGLEYARKLQAEKLAYNKALISEIEHRK